MKTDQTKIDEATFAIERVKTGVELMMARENVTAESMVIALLVNAASLFVHSSFAKGEPEAVRHHAFKQILEIFRRSARATEQRLKFEIGEALKAGLKR